jgi:hypothetical protein
MTVAPAAGLFLIVDQGNGRVDRALYRAVPAVAIALLRRLLFPLQPAVPAPLERRQASDQKR